MKQITDFVRGLALGVAVGILISSSIPARADTKKLLPVVNGAPTIIEVRHGF